MYKSILIITAVFCLLTGCDKKEKTAPNTPVKQELPPMERVKDVCYEDWLGKLQKGSEEWDNAYLARYSYNKPDVKIDNQYERQVNGVTRFYYDYIIDFKGKKKYGTVYIERRGTRWAGESAKSFRDEY